MPGVLVMTGASIFDQSFTLDANPELGLPEIMWNSTRIERDAFRGMFGSPEMVSFKEIAHWARPEDFWKNLDREKVYRIIEDRNIPVVRPYWKAGGKSDGVTGMYVYKLLDIPTITLMLRLPTGVTHAFPVDGNHRLKARELAGCETFERFVVPAELEGNYRIRFTEL